MATYECKYGCGYTSEHRGGMNLHEKFHCKKKETGGSERQEKLQEKKQDECMHKWRLLNTKSDPELRAIKAGYTEVCSKCDDLK